MAHNKVYGKCENYCDVEVMSKEEVEQSLEDKQKVITYGTSDPTGGNDGDIYIKVES